MYLYVWGIVILVGVMLFGIGWYVKGENFLKVLDFIGEIKKKEMVD